MQGSSLQGALDRRSEKVLGVRLTRSDELCGAATPSATVRLEADPRHCRDLVRAPADSSMAEADQGLPARAAEAAAALAAERPSARAPSPMPGARVQTPCHAARVAAGSSHNIGSLHCCMHRKPWLVSLRVSPSTRPYSAFFLTVEQ